MIYGAHFFSPLLISKRSSWPGAHSCSCSLKQQKSTDDNGHLFFFFSFLRAIPQFPLILEMCLIHLSICSDPCLSFEMDFVRVSFFLPFGLVDICLYVLLLTVLPRVVSVFFFFSPLLFIRRFVYNVSFYFSCPAHCIFTFIFPLSNIWIHCHLIAFPTSSVL